MLSTGESILSSLLSSQRFSTNSHSSFCRRGETCLHKFVCRAHQKDQETITKTVRYLLEHNADTSISGTRLLELVESQQLGYLKPILSSSKTVGPLEYNSSNTFSDGNMSLSTVVSQQGRLRVHKISIPLMLIESIRERSKVRSVDIITKHLRFCRFVFGDVVGASERKAYSEAERKAFLEAIRNCTPKSPRDIFTFPFSQHEIESTWNPANIDIYSWDSNDSMPTPLGISHRNLVSFSTGRCHTAALSMEGDVWVWGSGAQGQLGLGNVEKSWNPQRIPSSAFEGQKVQKVYCGGYQTAAVTEQGKLYFWGDCGLEAPEKPNSTAETPIEKPKVLGKSYSVLQKWPPGVASTNSSPQSSPQQRTQPPSPTLQSKKQAQTSSSLPTPTQTKASPPVIVSIPTLAKGLTGRTITQVALGLSHACVIVNEQEKTLAYSWGKNNYGQLGLKDTLDRREPTIIKALVNPMSVASGPYHVTAYTENRQVFSWGRCIVGPEIKSEVINSPFLLESLSGKALRDISCGNDFTVTVFQNGEVYSWGDGKRGTLGHGNCSSVSTPKLIERLSGKGVERVSCGNRHTVAYNGTSLWAWGSLVERTGIVVDQTYPKKIKSLAAKRVFRVSCGYRQSLAMLVEDPFDLLVEFRRQGVPNCYWRLCTNNANYGMCASYPRYIIVPRTVSDEVIQEVARFRTQGRIPCLTYKHSKNHATITRSSQPSVGLSGRRSPEDEKLLRCIVESNPQSDGVLHILDARPKANAVANQAVGAGYELSEHYKNLKIQFLGIENIHLMRESLHKLTNICRQKKVREGGEKKTSSNWLSELESTHWIDHIVTILASARMLTELVLKGKSAHVHCSDGWDRTTQLVCLAQLMLDPYFRTIRGFQVLIEKDWLRFGHRFGDRQGHFPDTSGSSQVGRRKHKHHTGRIPPLFQFTSYFFLLLLAQVSPIFLQFLDCVWQCTKQFPTCFEFNTRFLIKIFDHSHSGKYANFFCNSDRERRDMSRNPCFSASPSGSPSPTSPPSFSSGSGSGTSSAHSSMLGDNGETTKLKGACLWERMQKKASKYRNPDYLFSARNEELLPIANLKAVRLWRDFFFRWETSYR
jgi:alpha-tubulin suppressor-like RCC1 family protein